MALGAAVLHSMTIGVMSLVTELIFSALIIVFVDDLSRLIFCHIVCFFSQGAIGRILQRALSRSRPAPAPAPAPVAAAVAAVAVVEDDAVANKCAGAAGAAPAAGLALVVAAAAHKDL